MSTVRPCFFTHGAMQGMYNFPGWLGQNSKQSKANRLLREVQQKMKLKASADKSEIRLQYLPTLSKMLTKPMVEKETEGIEEVIERMDNYYLNREDWDNIMELGYQDLIKQIPTKNKSAFTRMYNKGSHPSPFAMTAAKGKGGGSFAMEMPDCEDVLVEDDQPNEEEEEEGEEEVEVVQPKKASKRQSSSKQSTSKTTTKKLKK
jgi:replication factor C subunit 1